MNAPVVGTGRNVLAGPLHHPPPALTGATIFVTFASGVLVQTTTTHWPPHRLLAAGMVRTMLGLVVLVASAWTRARMRGRLRTRDPRNADPAAG